MPIPLSRLLTGLLAFPIFSLAVSCGSSGGGGSDDGGGDDPLPEDGVSLFATGDDVTSASGSERLSVSSLTPLIDDHFVIVDAESGGVLIVDPAGRVFRFTAREELEALAGDTVDLGQLDEILVGPQRGHLVGADRNSGLLIRLLGDGAPVVHATEAQILNVTRQMTARISLPRYLLNSQIVAQELVSGDILLFGTTGATISRFVAGDELALRADVARSDAVITGWTRGGGSASLFARFDSTTSIVKLPLNGTTTTHVGDGVLAALFPDIENLRLLEIVGDTVTDALLLRVGDGERGVALARVDDVAPFTVSVYTDSEAFDTLLGNNFDISDIGVLADGVPFAIDRSASRILTFGAEGNPLLVAEADSISRESGAVTPRIDQGVRLGAAGVIVPERSSSSLVRVQ